MGSPVRLRLSRARGFDLQALSVATNGLRCVVVARPTIYGNPFVHEEPGEAVVAFRRYCSGGTQSFDMGPGKLQFAMRQHRAALHHGWPTWLRDEGLPAIRGVNLACWCKVGTPCHADVLLELANAGATDGI